eukprot:m.1255110 g.1255110  ORF g.1255110 m.1255110 type:complete len:71 (+) comp24709_c0_seq40:3777-3989(+)
MVPWVQDECTWDLEVLSDLRSTNYKKFATFLTKRMALQYMISAYCDQTPCSVGMYSPVAKVFAPSCDAGS